jgi:hypothetical protein
MKEISCHKRIELETLTGTNPQPIEGIKPYIRRLRINLISAGDRRLYPKVLTQQRGLLQSSHSRDSRPLQLILQITNNRRSQP